MVKGVINAILLGVLEFEVQYCFGMPGDSIGVNQEL